LILDEATSALDTATERNVHNRLRALSCTRIVVAHRLSTVVEADKIVVLDAGRVAGIGTHAQLYASCHEYRELVRAQADAPEARASRSAPASEPAPALRAVGAPLPVTSAAPQRSAPVPAGATAATVLAARLRAARPPAERPHPVQTRRPPPPPRG
jgi:ABC-type glutathione transport system ATPase component